MKREALGGLTRLGTQPGRTFTLQPENAEPTLAANDSLKVDDRFELIYKRAPMCR